MIKYIKRRLQKRKKWLAYQAAKNKVDELTRLIDEFCKEHDLRQSVGRVNYRAHLAEYSYYYDSVYIRLVSDYQIACMRCELAFNEYRRGL